MTLLFYFHALGFSSLLDEKIKGLWYFGRGELMGEILTFLAFAGIIAWLLDKLKRKDG
jgi:hypothetical protein